MILLISQKKTDFDGKLKNLNTKVTSYETKHIMVKNELNQLSEEGKLLSTKDYGFFLERMYFTSDDGSQNTFVYQPFYQTV